MITEYNMIFNKQQISMYGSLFNDSVAQAI
jgi:hypothetical protein